MNKDFFFNVLLPLFLCVMLLYCDGNNNDTVIALFSVCDVSINTLLLIILYQIRVVVATVGGSK